jgi:hypothetical protein
MYGRGTFFLEIRLGKALRMESTGIAKPMPSPNKALMLIMPITSPTSFSLHSTRGPQTTNRIQIYILYIYLFISLFIYSFIYLYLIIFTTFYNLNQDEYS